MPALAFPAPGDDLVVLQWPEADIAQQLLALGDPPFQHYVNNAQVGTWYTGGVNLPHKARYDSFEIPASFTSGKSSITIKIQFVSSANDWNEFVYDAYSHVNLSPSP